MSARFATPLITLLLAPLSGAAWASGEADSLALARVESLSRATRISEGRILDEIEGRLGRIESTTQDIRALLEAMPDGGVRATPATAPVATPVPAARIPKPASGPVPACKPAPGLKDAELVDDDATHVPPVLIAGASAILALALGLFLGRRRHDNPASHPPAPQTPISSENPVPPLTESLPLWTPKAKTPVPAVGGMSGAGMAAQPKPSTVAQNVSNGQATPAIARSEHAAAADEPVTVLPTEVEEVGGKEQFDPTLELAEIMMSMGLASGAAQALEEHIRENPREAVVHWLKLLDVYRKDGHRSDFEKVARELRKNFNIRAADWLNVNGKEQTLEDFDRIRQQVVDLWPQPKPCVDYLTHLLEDNRDGMRNGFPQSVAEEILLLIAIQKSIHPELAATSATETPGGSGTSLELA